MLTRERWEKVSQWELSMMAIGLFLGSRSDALQAILKTLRDELTRHAFQTVYDPKVVMVKLQRELNKVKEDRERIRALEAMTVK